jgi:hypothetical protein
MQKAKKFLSCLLVAAMLSSTAVKANDGDKKKATSDKAFPSLLSNSSLSPAFKQVTDSIFQQIGLLSYGLDKDVFYNAYKGYQYLLKNGMLKKTNLLTICDYSQSSNNQRLYVIDLEEGKLLYNTFVTHGKNSGEEFATSFSNSESSNKSSLGFLVTAETYTGKAGLSLRFDGVERGFNDNVRARDIVLHGSRFVTRSLLGGSAITKSLGCPAVPFGVHKSIINTIKGGSCFYVNHPDQMYVRSSPILNAQIDFMPQNLALRADKNSTAGNGSAAPSMSAITQ